METFINGDGKEFEKNLEIRFLDSLKFRLKSLGGLVKGLGPDQFKTLEREMGTNELLKKKGVFPYEYMTGFDKLAVNELPPKKDFYSKLNDAGVSDEQYEHARNVWTEFRCKTMRDYHDLYLKTDVLLLADVMENYRDVCMENYGLDPMCYYTAPGLTWDATLKISEIKLELLINPDMYLMVEAGTRGGISTITKRYAKANNKYMNKYDCEKESSHGGGGGGRRIGTFFLKKKGGGARRTFFFTTETEWGEVGIRAKNEPFFTRISAMSQNRQSYTTPTKSKPSVLPSMTEKIDFSFARRILTRLVIEAIVCSLTRRNKHLFLKVFLFLLTD